MKSQRSFVVVKKNSRRQSKAQASSIWGDTDFKALAREAEIDAPGIFVEQPVAAEPPAAEPALVEEVAEAPAPIGAPEIIPTPEPVEAALPEVAKRQPARKRSESKPQPQTSRKPTATPAAVPTYDALIELEDANRTLRAQLRKRLEAERARLVEMLERVNIRQTAA
ncbi:hypothetical protein J2Y63_004890 [Shinella sp. BE166]|uniref:hypothetical protein n=1 Tax=Shinella sp. BE166 TaxID=3373918 RepID=UPI003EBFEAE9